MATSSSSSTGNPLIGMEVATDRILNKLTAYNQAYAGGLESVADQIKLLNADLLEDNGGEADLSVTGVMIFEQWLKKMQDVLGRVSSEHRDMHTSVSKVGKEIDKALTADLAGTCLREEQYENVASKRSKINTLIADKLLSQGLLDVAEMLEEESGVSLAGRDREKFQVVNVIMDSLRQRELSLAVQLALADEKEWEKWNSPLFGTFKKWCEAHRTQLNANGSPLEYSLLRLQFIKMLTSADPAQKRAALKHAKHRSSETTRSETLF